MANMKSMMALAAMYAAMEYGGHSGVNPNIDRPRETEEQKKNRLEKYNQNIQKKRGLSEFFYGENSLWALNKKNADKKAKNRGWI